MTTRQDAAAAVKRVSAALNERGNVLANIESCKRMLETPLDDHWKSHYQRQLEY